MSLLGGGLLSGDIWSTSAFSFESPLKDLLDGGEYSLQQLLAEDELLQELRGVHPKLVTFFSTAAAVTQLVHYIVDPKPLALGMGGRTAASRLAEEQLTPKDPAAWLEQKGSTQDPEMLYIRFPFMACEIFCCEIDGIVNLLVDAEVEETKTDETNNDDSNNTNNKQQSSHTKLLDLLFSVITDTPVGALDDYRAGYFEKLLRVLLKKRPTAMADYLRDNKTRLIPAMLQHLYSHSIMQIAQRLLLPHRPTPKKNGEDGDGKDEDDDDDDNNNNNNESALLTPPEGDDDEPIETCLEIKCEWSTSEQAIEILLDSMIGPLNSNNSSENGCALASNHEQEQSLDLSLNASEVLITIVQNSMLSSNQMLNLTSTPVLTRIMKAATTLRPDPNVFSYHESLLTSAMSVLESLILQLGGYGAVGTMSLVEDTTMEEDNNKMQDEDDEETNGPLIANLSSMIDILPTLLEKLSELLTHPSTSEWKTYSQVHKQEPQPMLGSSRLRIVRVLEALVLLGDPDVDQKLVQSDCLEICLDFFWEFQWCSMLHQSVANLLVHVFEGGNVRVDMQEYFLIRCNILVRLMDSFQEAALDQTTIAAETISSIHDAVAAAAAEAVSEECEQPEKENSTDNDPLPISEDDVDAAIEQEADADEDHSTPADNSSLYSTEAVQFMSRTSSSVCVGQGIPTQAFRYGYMGHVIIICQALVHACAQMEADDDDQTRQSEDGTRSVRSADRLAGIKRPAGSVVSRNTNDSLSKGEEESIEKEPLFLAEMVRYHPLSDRWDEFVHTSLSTETSIQSTPLGGYNASSSGHRPGLADDGDLGFDGQPSLPSRSLLGELDMDDNDLDIAANMMAALAMGRGHREDDDDDFSGSGDSNRSYNSGETNHSGGYLFDDPLGKDNTGLGIELGKLTKLNLDQDEENGGDGSSSHSSSSDEEGNQDDEDNEAPIMDLFAGNFNYDQSNDPSAPAPSSGSFDFANFDDAFADLSGPASDDDYGAFVDAVSDSPSFEAEGGKVVDDVFSSSDNTDLLIANGTDAHGESNVEVIVISSCDSASPEVVESIDKSESGIEVDAQEADPLDIDSVPSDETPANASIETDSSLQNKGTQVSLNYP